MEARHPPESPLAGAGAPSPSSVQPARAAIDRETDDDRGGSAAEASAESWYGPYNAGASFDGEDWWDTEMSRAAQDPVWIEGMGDPQW